MYLPSYKINNSYTVYVNYFYLNDCIKAGKKQAKQKAQTMHTEMTSRIITQPKPQSLAANTQLYHKKYGVGKVVSTDKDGIMKVAFDTKVLHFIYPEAMRKGQLSIISK